MNGPKKIKINEAQFVSLFGDEGNGNFYQDGDFYVTNDSMQKGRDIFYPYYKDRYNENKDEIIHDIAFNETIRMLDNGQKLPEFGDEKFFHSIRGIPFSDKQVYYVEKKIVIPKYKDMDLEELYDYLIIDMERSKYEFIEKGKAATEKLINNGFFDDYLNGHVKDLALWSVGKLGDTNDMLAWLFSRDRFTGRINVALVDEEMKKTIDEICESDSNFLYNDTFLALDYVVASLMKLDKIPKKV